MRFLAPTLLLSFTLASCVAPPVERPAPVPPVVERPAPPPPAPAPVSNDWTDWPVTPGDWRYAAEQGGTIARFGPVGGAPLLSFRCDPVTQRIFVMRAGGGAGAGAGGAFTIRTSFGVVQWPVEAITGGLLATRTASDAAFDQIAFSRGRFVLESAGAPPLVVPTWAEVARVVEDCRG